MDHYSLLIGGELVDAAGGKRAESIDPGSGRVVASHAVAGPDEAAQAIDAAYAAFESGVWSDVEPRERARILMDLADRIAEKARALALLEARDSGGMIRRTMTDVLLGSRLIRNLARYAADEFPWVERIDSGVPMVPSRNTVRREPVGVCVGIIPWNFPFVMANWKITMAVLMGNTVVLKPASDTPLSALALGAIVAQSHIPAGVINIIAGSGGQLSTTLCTDPRVAKIAFTGSTEVGRAIMTQAASTIKKVTLELGGKSANIVLDDADLESAVDGALLATFLHSGQVCESGTRLLLPESLYDSFMDKLVARAESIRVGYQLDPKAKMGPLVSAKQLATVESYVQIGREEGATLCTGGERAEVAGCEGGFYFAPTIFGDVDNSWRIAQEEIFGPVLSVIRYRDEEEAIALANDSIYGLAGGVWSTNIERAERIAAQVRTGTMWINDFHVFSDLAPFGGYKQSGVGRELGHWGLAEYTEVKHVHVGSEGRPAHRGANRLLLRYPRTTSVTWTGPTRLSIGVGRAAMAGDQIERLGGRRVLLVSDPGLERAGLLAPVVGALGALRVATFIDVPQDSGFDTVDAAARAGRDAGVDAVVSLGGGSVIDTAKVVSACLSDGGSAIDYVGASMLTCNPLPHLVIPTTAGTGSEVTNSAVIYNRALGQKAYVVDDRIIPPAAILDPALLAGLPAALTCSTGMDALTHAVEAVVSKMRNPISEGLALQAIRVIQTTLPRCVEAPDDLEARVAMQMAASMAGWAFSVAQTGLVHGMSHALGARCRVPHGVANGILLPHVIRFNAPAAPDKMAAVAEALGGERQGDELALATSAADAVSALLERIGHPMRLRDVNVSASELQACARLACEDLVTLTNPRAVSSEAEVVEIYNQAI